MLSAADRLFTEQGYHAVRTRDIADAAGVGESVVFRNFGSKADLFEVAILTPFSQFIDSWAKSWDRRPPSSSDPEVITRTFVKGIYAFVDEHRALLSTLMAAQMVGDDPRLAEVASVVAQQFTESLLVMRRVLLTQGDARHYEKLDPPLTVAVSVGSILSLLVMPDWLFPSFERRPSRARQIEELTQMLLYGVSGRTASK